MLFFYQGSSKSSGIYEIRNRHTNRSYIGQAKEFKNRWTYGHKQSLIKNRNLNKYLLNDFNKCLEQLGHDNFIEFHILELMPYSTKDERNIREEFWIKTYEENGYQLYNFIKKITNKERSCFSNTPEETRLKHSKAFKKMWSDSIKKQEISNAIKEALNQPECIELRIEVAKQMWQNPSHIEKMIAIANSPEAIERFIKNCHTPEVIKKTAKNLVKNHGKIISPIGEVFEVNDGVKNFCRDHELPLSGARTLIRVIKNEIPSFHGWRPHSDDVVGTKYVNRLTEDHFASKEFKILSPNGETFEGKNVTEFCALHNLRKENITAVLNGRRRSHLGWVKVPT